MDTGFRFNGSALQVNEALPQSIAAFRITHLLHNTTQFSEAIVQQLLQMLDQCFQEEYLPNVVSPNGYNLIQLAVAHNLVDVVERVFSKRMQVGLDDYCCSDLLHIACKCGHVRMVKLLLEKKADMFSSVRMCFPKPHTVIINSLGQGTTTPYCEDFEGLLYTPIQVAIAGKHEEVVKILIQWVTQGSPGKKVNRFWRSAVYHAVKHQSKECLCTIAVNARQHGKHDLWPFILHQALKVSEKFGVKMLKWGIEQEKNGQDYHSWFFRAGDESIDFKAYNVLCDVFNLPSLKNFYKVFRLFIEAGYDPQFLHQADIRGQSPIEILLHKVGCCYWRRQKARREDVEKQEQIYLCIKHCINMKYLQYDNSSDLQMALFKMMSEWCFKMVWPNNRAAQPLRLTRCYKRCAEFILKSSSADLGGNPATAVPIISGLIGFFANLDMPEADGAWQEFTETIETLLVHKANPNIPNRYEVTTCTFLYTSLRDWLQAASKNPNLHLRMVQHVYNLLHLMFSYGLSPAVSTVNLCIRQIAVSSDLKFSENTEEEVFKMMGLLLQQFFMNGTNPDQLELIIDDPSLPPLHDLITTDFYLANGLTVHAGDQRVWPILDVFVRVLTQAQLEKLVAVIRHWLVRPPLLDVNGVSLGVSKELLALVRNPRSLYVLARQRLWRSVGWQVGRSVGQLGLTEHQIRSLGLVLQPVTLAPRSFTPGGSEMGD